MNKQITLALFLAFGVTAVTGQCTNHVTHFNGSDSINHVLVTVSTYGHDDSNSVYCANTRPYFVGYNYISGSGNGSYTFTFSPPVDSVTLNFSGISFTPPNQEAIVLTVNGHHYAVPSVGAPNGCDPLAALTTSGDITGCTNCSVSGWDGTVIAGPVTTLSILDTAYSGFGNGTLFSLFFCNRLSVVNPPPPVATFMATDTVICQNNCIQFTDLSTGTPSGWHWFFPGGSPSGSFSQIPPTICYDTSGHYDVTLIAANTNGADTVTYPHYITVNAHVRSGTIVALPDTICPGTQSTLSVTGNTGAVQWQLANAPVNFSDISGATGNSYLSNAMQTTYYRVYTGGNCGDTSASLKLLVNPLPVAVPSSNDTLICSGDSTMVCVTDTFASYVWNDGSISHCTWVKVAGGYWVTVTGANGCTAVSSHKNIRVYPVPSVSIIVQGDTLSSFNSVAYQWYLNGALLQGDTLDVYVAHQPGNYTVQVTDTNGCTTTSNAVIITGIEELEENRLLLYPNPSIGILKLEVGTELIGGTAEIYDNNGRVVWGLKLRDRILDIQLNVSPGVYWLQISSPNANIIRKLVRL